MRYSKKIVVQIFAGGFQGEVESASNIINRLEKVTAALDIESVIIGWAALPELYNELYKYLNKKGILMHLWYPLFSEVGCFRPLQKVIGHDNREIKSYSLQEGENFEFYCPGNSENLALTMEIFDELYSGANYDGVFLDKIRYPALSNGPASIFTCFCPGCIDKMEQAGIDVVRLWSVIASLLAEGSLSTEPVGFTSSKELSFKNPLLEQFFWFKEETIRSSLSKVSSRFRQRSKMVGFDLFAPSFAYLSGQSINRLTPLCDFVKPMYYRRTKAPAGLPFELSCLEGDEAAFRQIVGASSDDEFLTDSELLAELNSLKEAQKVYPGFEVNRIEGVVDSDPAYIERCLALIENSPAAGAVLSWNLMEFPEENLEYILSTV